jgi:hypothetical protein
MLFSTSFSRVGGEGLVETYVGHALLYMEAALNRLSRFQYYFMSYSERQETTTCYSRWRAIAPMSYHCQLDLRLSMAVSTTSPAVCSEVIVVHQVHPASSSSMTSSRSSSSAAQLMPLPTIIADRIPLMIAFR